MGLYDRDYTQSGYGMGGYSRRGFAMGGLTPAVKWLLIANVAVFVLERLFIAGEGLQSWTRAWLSVLPAGLGYVQVWRLLTYQFLHVDFWHLFFNMLILFFFGRSLEGYWGTKRFAYFYLVCGAAGGILFQLLVAVGWLDAGPMIGASGAVLGVLAAVAILFPQTTVFLFFVIPVPIRVLAVILAGVAIFSVISASPNAGGEAAHLAGMVTGGLYVLLRPRIDGRLAGARHGAWARRMERQRRLQGEVDRILDKVHDHGLNSLTRREKRILREATRLEQTRNGVRK